MGKKDARVDAYIARSAEFARPILTHLRKVVHTGCPEVEETLKWKSPTFMYKGILCGMAAFKGHCVFGFWKHALLEDRLDGTAGKEDSAMGQFGRITAISDLPGERALISLVKAAMDLNDRGIKTPSRARPKGPQTLVVPDYFRRALGKNKKALAAFEGFSHSHKKEYVDWVTEARGDETRKRRLETSIAWMSEGRARNWKYIRK